MRKKLFFLKQQQLSVDGASDELPLFPGGADEGEGGEESKEAKEIDEGKPGPSGTGKGEEADTLIDEQDLLRRAHEDYETGSYSPKLIKFADVEEVS